MTKKEDSKLKINDHVICISRFVWDKEHMSLHRKKGKIIAIKPSNHLYLYLVEFKDNIDGHNGDSLVKDIEFCKDNNCWWIKGEILEKTNSINVQKLIKKYTK